jgi:hypothetical protein
VFRALCVGRRLDGERGDLRLPDIKEASERDLAMLPGGCGGCEAWLEGIGVEMCEGEISG